MYLYYCLLYDVSIAVYGTIFKEPVSGYHDYESLILCESYDSTEKRDLMEGIDKEEPVYCIMALDKHKR
jgi:hypothetical protein